jgi:pheromone shutdown protein TraB
MPSPSETSPGMEPVRDAIRLAVVDAFQDATVQTVMRSVAYSEAKRAMRDGMLTVGVDLTKPAETMDDLKQLREWNVLRKAIKNQVTKSVVVVLVTGLLSAIALGFKEQWLALLGIVRPH